MSAQTEDQVVIELSENGPLLVKGSVNIRNSRGEDLPGRKAMALCRCGGSGNKPFCDGTHSKIAFSGKREIDKPLHRERAYRAERITIHDNRTICFHAKECVNNLSSVFDVNEKPWINPDGADVEQVIDVVKKCPSGALSYSIDGEHYRNFDRKPAITVTKNGPYNIVGGVKLMVEENLQPPAMEHYSLCRCGVSKNKPYCDGSHNEFGFVDEKN